MSNGSGKLTTDFDGTYDCGNSVTVQADGKILVAGTSGADLALARYNANGSLDTSFSGDGKLTTDFGGTYDYGNSVTVQADGKILVAGTSGTDLALARYNANGSLDTSFSSDGKLTTNFGTYDYGNSVTVQADGKILVAGMSGTDFALVRYTANGSLDTSFSADGKLTTDFGAYDYGNSVTVQADGKILVAGFSNYYDFALVRYNANGSLDTSFSGDGKLTTDFFGMDDWGRSVTVQDDGKILVAGGSNGDFTLARYTTDGRLDTSFSGDGKLITDFGTDMDDGYSVTVQADGKILVAGTSGDDFALARYNTDGTLDVTFGSAVIYHWPTGNVTISGMATQGQMLTAVNTLTDADGLGQISYQWLADGVSITGATGNTLTLPQALVGKAISVKASYIDLLGAPESATSAVTSKVLNANDAPTGSVTISGTATQGQTLTAANTLADIDGLGQISYQWLADGVAITGATGRTLTLAQAQVGKAISVQASYTDVLGTAERVTSSATTQVANVNDAPSGNVTISGMATQGQVLTAASTLTDADGLGQISYQWLADGVEITGATGRTLTLAQAQVGKAISVDASYTDLQGTAESVTSSATVEVANVNDAARGSVTISGAAKQGQTLTVANTLTDADGLGQISYQWLADGVEIDGATGNTLIPSQALVGKVISVKASYIDLLGAPESATSAVTFKVLNANDAPTGSVTISGTATQGQTLTAANTLADIDGLGQISYQWLADGWTITGATGKTLTLGQAQVGKAISVQARYTDALGTAERVTSSAMVKTANVNDLGLVTISGTATQGQVLLATVADVDGLPGTGMTYQWLADGVAITGATGRSLTLAQAQVDKAVSVEASYTDVLGTAERVTSSATAKVANVNDLGTLAISGTAFQKQVLTAMVADADGVPGTGVTYQWLADGVVITGATAKTYTLTQSDAGHTISAVASYQDLQGTQENLTKTMTTLVGGIFQGGVGNDTLNGSAGNDVIFADAGRDLLFGGLGSDSLHGGMDWVKDLFDFNAIAESTPGSARDKVHNFVTTIDQIDLADIDADTAQAGDQEFAFSGTSANANSVWYQVVDVNGSATTQNIIVYGDVSGDAEADFEIMLIGMTVIAAADFVL